MKRATTLVMTALVLTLVAGHGVPEADAQVLRSPWGVSQTTPSGAAAALSLPASVAHPYRGAACGTMACTGLPTAQRCSDPCWVKACVKSTIEEAQCKGVLTPVFKQQVAAIPLTKSLVAPPAFPRAGERIPTKRLEFDARRMTTSGLAGSLAKDRAWAHNGTVPRPVTTTPEARGAATQLAYIDALRTAWNQNGSQVSSCDEVAFEKYHSYTTFIDAVARNGDTPRKIFDLAFSPTHALPSRPNVLTKQGQPALDRGGRTVAFGLPMISRPKNAFVGALPVNGLSMPYPNTTISHASLPAACRPHVMAESSFGPAGRVAALRTLRTTQTYAGEQAASTTLRTQGWDDEDLELRYRKQQELGKLLERRHRIMAPNAVSGPTPTPGPGGNPAQLQQEMTNIYCGLAAFDRELEVAFKEARDLKCFDLGTTPCDWSPNQFADQLLASTTTRAVDTAREADARECDALTSAGTLVPPMQPWRWKPAIDDFVRTANASGPVTNNNPTVNFNDFRKDIRSFDAFMTRARGFLAQAAKDRELTKVEAQVADPDRPGKFTLGRQILDSGSLGGDMFGGRYEVKAGWSTGNWQYVSGGAKVCQARVRTWAFLDARATVLWRELPVAYFDSRAGLSQVTTPGQQDPVATFTTSLDARVLGVTLWTGTYAKTFPTSFHLVASPESSLRSPAVGTSFSIAGVPVNVYGYAAGTAGVDFALHGSGRASCSNNPITELDFEMSGRLAPEATVEGIAELSIGVRGMLEAGVRGRLTLVRLALPLTVDAKAKWAPASNAVRFTANQALDFELGTLDGRLSAYLSLLGQDVAEEDLFKWDGFTYQTRLMGLDYGVGLKNAALALQ